MATLTIRNLDDEVHARLKAQAKRNGRSVEAEARVTLGERVDSADDWIEDLRAFQREMFAKHGYFGDSVALIRQIRDEE